MSRYLKLGLVTTLAIPGIAVAAETVENAPYSAHLAALPRGYTVLVAPTARASGATEYTIAPQREEGWASARVERKRLVVSGSFTGLGSAARAVHLHASPVTGVGGPAIAPLHLLPPGEGGSGRFEGTVPLDRQRLELLRGGRLYVQIGTAERPEGDIRGWLLPGGKVR